MEVPTRREMSRGTRRAVSKGQHRLLGVFGPRVTARGSQLTRKKVKALEKLYSSDHELLYLMSAVELLRDETEKLAEELEVFVERGLEVFVDAGHALGEDLLATSRRALNKNVVLPDAPCSEAALMGDVLSLEALLREAAESESLAASDLQTFASDCLNAVRSCHDDLERVHSVRIAPLRNAHERAFDVMRAPQKKLERLMAKDEESLAKDKTQRSIAEAEALAQQQQAALRVTSVKLKSAAHEFLMEFTPRVHAVTLAFMQRQGQALRKMAARNDALLTHQLIGWDKIKQIRRGATEVDIEDSKRMEEAEMHENAVYF